MKTAHAPEDSILFTVMYLKIGMDANKLCAWFNWNDEFVSSFLSLSIYISVSLGRLCVHLVISVS
jgi:hypothetical protein